MGQLLGWLLTPMKLRHCELSFRPGQCREWSSLPWAAYHPIWETQLALQCFGEITSILSSKTNWSLTHMQSSRPKVSCLGQADYLIYFLILMYQTGTNLSGQILSRPLVRTWHLKLSSSWISFFGLDYEHVKISLSSLAEKISDPEWGRQLNALSILSNHLIGDANDIWWWVQAAFQAWELC